jgi:hypothetical protein
MKVYEPKKREFDSSGKEPQRPGGVCPLDEAPQTDGGETTEQLDEALEESFPASDPPAMTTPQKKRRGE